MMRWRYFGIVLGLWLGPATLRGNPDASAPSQPLAPATSNVGPSLHAPTADRGSPSRDPHAATNSLPMRIVVLGDSLSAGLGLDPSQAYPALLQRKIEASGWKDIVVNAGVSGDTSADGLGRINWLLKQRIDVLILELGANDGLRGIPVESTRKNLQAIINRVKEKYPGARIILAGMRMPPNLGQTYTESFQKIFPRLAKQNHAALIPFLLEGVAGNPRLNQPDGMHPTAQGQHIVAENVWKVLKPVLEKLRSRR